MAAFAENKICPSRSYDPLAEYCALDVEKSGINLYAYVGSSPVRNVDAAGLDAAEVNAYYAALAAEAA
jgi:hypothetical protein